VKWLVAICEDMAGLMESRPTGEWLYRGCTFFFLKRFSVTCAVAFGFTSKTGRTDLLSLYPRPCGSTSTKSRDLFPVVFILQHFQGVMNSKTAYSDYTVQCEDSIKLPSWVFVLFNCRFPLTPTKYKNGDKSSHCAQELRPLQVTYATKMA
jgi:hypothetical protein